MMTLPLMMFPSEMMSASPDVFGKNRIIASKTNNIIFAKQMHHIAAGDASFISKKIGYFSFAIKKDTARCASQKDVSEKSRLREK